MSREVITLQFGNYANYIGAHWWNIQESSFNYDPTAAPSMVDHDVLFREGCDVKGNTTFTPRLLLVDLEGSLRHFPEDGALYNTHRKPTDPGKSVIDEIRKDIFWEESDIEVIQKGSEAKNEFQSDVDNPDVDITEKEYNLTENTKTWTDFVYTRFHPRTINLVKEYKFSEEKESFDTYSNGARIWDTEYFEDHFTDRIRQYVEETDNLQGFQNIFDCTNAFSGLSLRCMEHLNDEYAKSIFAVPVFAPRSVLFENADEALTDSIRLVNIAMTYSKLAEHSSLFLPLSTHDREWRQKGSARQFPLLNYKEDNAYQTSSILASFLETLSLRYRMKDYPGYLAGFCGDMNNYGRKLTAGAFALPLRMNSGEDLIDCLDKLEGDLFTQISPNTKIGTDYVVQSACVRGIPKERLKRPLKAAQKQMKMAAYRCESVSEMFQLYFQCSNHNSMAHTSAIPTAQPVKTPFPLEMFDERLNFAGFVSDVPREEGSKVLSVPTLASIQSSGDLADTLESLHRDASRIKIRRLHRFKETGMEEDDYVEVLERILEFKDNYEDNYDL